MSPSDPAMVEAAEMIFSREVEHGDTAVVQDDSAHFSKSVRRLSVGTELVVVTIPMGGG